jgi:hypothetical protein
MANYLGKWHKLILSELENKEAFFISDLISDLKPHCSPSQYSYIRKAAFDLEDAKKIIITHFWHNMLNDDLLIQPFKR